MMIKCNLLEGEPPLYDVGSWSHSGGLQDKMSYVVSPQPVHFQSHTFNRGGHGYALKKNCRYLISAALHLRQNHGRDGVAKEKEIHISEALSADER
jgi:hypothetical protein